MIENIKTIMKVEENIIPFIKKSVIPKKAHKLENFMVEQGVWGDEKYVIYHTGTRENTQDTVYLFQIGLENKEDDLWFVVEEDELKHEKP